MKPQPHSKLPTEPGWWRRNASCGDDEHTYVNAVRIKDGVAEAYTPWDWSPCNLFAGEWVRCVGPLLPGDPGYEPEPPKPALPEPDRRFVPPPAVETPVLEPCPYCGTAPVHQGKAGVYCHHDGCCAYGPMNDADGAKWNRVARAAKGAQP